MIVVLDNNNNVLYNAAVANNQFKYGRFGWDGSSIQIGTVLQTTQGPGGPKESERKVYMSWLKKEKFRNDFELIEMNLNHYEVVISNKVVDLILTKLENVYNENIYRS